MTFATIWRPSVWYLPLVTTGTGPTGPPIAPTCPESVQLKRSSRKDSETVTFSNPSWNKYGVFAVSNVPSEARATYVYVPEGKSTDPPVVVPAETAAAARTNGGGLP